MSARFTTALVSSALLFAGCGGSAPAKAPEAQPAGAYPPQQNQQPGYPPATTDEESGGFAQPPPDALGPSEKDADRDGIDELNLELDRAASELSAAGSDCTRACKALRSMSRASERICALEPDDSSASRCRRAKERVAEAADRVRRSCTCP